MPLLRFPVLLLLLATSLAGQTPQPPRSVRLYVFDCGTLHVADVTRFRLTPAEVATSDLAVACYLIVHPKGTLMWDTGAVPNASWTPTGTAVTQHLMLPDSVRRNVVVIKSLTDQLAELGILRLPSRIWPSRTITTTTRATPTLLRVRPGWCRRVSAPPCSPKRRPR